MIELFVKSTFCVDCAVCELDCAFSVLIKSKIALIIICAFVRVLRKFIEFVLIVKMLCESRVKKCEIVAKI